MEFRIFQGINKLWYWSLHAKNGLKIADGSEGYASSGNCRKAANRVIKGVQAAEVYTDK